jgi:hypothetical protein
MRRRRRLQGRGRRSATESLPRQEFARILCHGRKNREEEGQIRQETGTAGLDTPALPAIPALPALEHRHCRPRRVFDSFLCRGRISASFSAAAGIFCRESVFGCFLLMLLLLLLVHRGVYEKISSKEEDIGDPRECVLGCVQLIWIHGGQEFVLFVLGDMYGALQLHLGGYLCLQSG